MLDSLSFATKKSEELFPLLSSSNHGLSAQEAQRKLREVGPNTIGQSTVSWVQVLGRQFKSPFIYLLIAAAALAFSFGETIDGLMILLFIVLNTVLGFYQEFRSERTLQLLKRFVQFRVAVVRDEKEHVIDASELVPGDIIIVKTGDKIPADVRFVEAFDVSADESILTGESVAIGKSADPMQSVPEDLYKASNMGFAGTTVVRGEARAIVVATGKKTAMGKIARLTVETRHVSNFEKGISRFSKFILRLVMITLVLVFLANILIKGGDTNIGELVIFSIALAVSVIPEALPIVMTFSLSRGALKLAKQHVVVKRLSAIEDLGGVQILCTDKTGTLTENVLTVDGVSPGASPDLLLYANLASTEAEKHEPFDKALWNALPKQNRDASKDYSVVCELPFDPVRRRNTVVVQKGSANGLIVRGAPEDVLKLSLPLPGSDLRTLETWVQAKGREGRRVLAVATRSLPAGNKPSPETLEAEEKGLRLLGIVAFVDPIKPSAFEAVKQAKKLGVTIKILTGDSKEVAGAVAHQIRLVHSPDQVMTGHELNALPIDKQHEAVREYAVFSRVSPEQKFRIIQLLEEKFDVGFLGEGINDTPALKIAGVSLVVESASDVAREAADIVLLKKDLKVIIDGIEDGREVFANTIKYIKATLASNFGNFYAVAIASLFIDFLPMLPVQILLLNLLSDFPMIGVSTDTVDKSEIAKPRSYNVRDITLIATLLGIVSTVFDFIFFGLFFRVSPAVLQTNWFIGSILTELVFLFSIRTRYFFLKTRRPSPLIVWLTVAAASLTVAIPFLSFGGTVFHFTPPTAMHLAIIGGIVLLYFICSESVKLFYYRTFGQQK